MATAAKDINFDDLTLGAARRALFERLDDGLRCPCCRRHAQRYRRAYNAGMARALVELYRLGDGVSANWVDTRALRRFTGGGGDYAKNCFWSLATREIRSDGSRGGRMRITPHGVAFVHGLTTIRRYAIEYDSLVDGYAGAPISISDALKRPFDWRELMDGGNNGPAAAPAQEG